MDGKTFMKTQKDQPTLYPPQFKGVIKDIGDIIRNHSRFLVCGHVRPDGDCIGSQMTLYYLLKQMKKTVRLFNSGPILSYLKVVPQIEKIETTYDKTFEHEVCIYVDCGAQDRVNGDIRQCQIVINIDHHKSNVHFGDVNYIDSTATAVGEQLFHIIDALGEPFTKEIAESIYLSLLTDSGCFCFSNTSNVTFAVASRMVTAGANPSAIAQGLLDERSHESISLKAQVLSHLNYLCGERLVWGEITQEMYRAAGGEDNEPDGLVSDMRGISGVVAAILIHEIPEGGLRAGLRSKGSFDVSRIASEMGGGGHTSASGLYVKGDYGSLKEQLLSSAVRHMDKFRD